MSVSLKPQSNTSSLTCADGAQQAGSAQAGNHGKTGCGDECASTDAEQARQRDEPQRKPLRGGDSPTHHAGWLVLTTVRAACKVVRGQRGRCGCGCASGATTTNPSPTNSKPVLAAKTMSCASKMQPLSARRRSKAKQQKHACRRTGVRTGVRREHLASCARDALITNRRASARRSRGCRRR